MLSRIFSGSFSLFALMVISGCTTGQSYTSTKIDSTIDEAASLFAHEPIVDPPPVVTTKPVPSGWLISDVTGEPMDNGNQATEIEKVVKLPPTEDIATAEVAASDVDSAAGKTESVSPVAYAAAQDDLNAGFDPPANGQPLSIPVPEQTDGDRPLSVIGDSAEQIPTAPFVVPVDRFGAPMAPIQNGGVLLAGNQSIGSYLVEVGDQVELKFLYRPELNETLIVGEDGMIYPAIVPAMRAQGKTAFALKQEMASVLELRRYDARANLQDENRSVDYLIAVDDQIEVRFSVVDELNDTVTVRPDGKISLARIGEVVAEGKTPLALQNELEQRYKEKIRQAELVVIMRQTTSPNVYVNGNAVPLPMKGISEFSVSVTKTAPRVVYVMGELNRPSAVPYYPNMTVLRAISSAGGTKRTANLKHVMIMRSSNGCDVTEICADLRPCRKFSFGINSCKDGGFSDFCLMPNDVILVPQTKIAKVQDWLDQHVYNLFPPLRNSSVFSVIYNNGIPGFNSP